MADPKLFPLTDRLFLVQGASEGRFPFSHSFLVLDEVSALIDTGTGPEVLTAVREKYRPQLIVNSHCHPDHCAGNHLFPKAVLHVPQEGWETFGQKELLAPRLTEPGRLAREWQEFVTETMFFSDRAPDRTFSQGQVLDLGRTKLRALHTPGHTEDHYSLFEERTGLLLCFDLDPTGLLLWYGHRESDLARTRASLKRLQALSPGILVSSHFPPERGVTPEMLSGWETVLDKREEKILGLLARPADLEELTAASPIYGSYRIAPNLARYWESQMILKHLDELKEKGLIRDEGERWQRV